VSSPSLLSSFTVVLTTYGTLAAEAPLKHRQAAKATKQGSASAPIDLAEDEEGEASGGEGRGGRASSGGRGGGGKRRGAGVKGGPLFKVRRRCRRAATARACSPAPDACVRPSAPRQHPHPLTRSSLPH
jgi:hypothetical protein